MKTYALIRDCWLHLPPTAFLCVEQKKMRVNGGGSATKYEGKRKQKRNLKEKWVRHKTKTLRKAMSEGHFLKTFFFILNTEDGINLCLFIHSSIYHKMSIWSRHCHIMDLCEFNLRREKNQIAGPPCGGVAYPTLLSGTKRRREKKEVREGKCRGSCCSAVTHSCPQDCLDL